MLNKLSLNKFLTWFSMGHYGPYVWSAYAIAAFILCLNVWYTKRYYRHILGMMQDAD